MRPVSAAFKAALNVSHKRVTACTVTVPGGSPFGFDINPGSTVTSSSGSGARRMANLAIPPILGVNLFEMMATPGAVFDIEHGIDFGGGNRELHPVFHGEVSATSGVDIFGGQIPLAFVDGWQRLERCRFTSPRVVGTGYRPNIIASAIVEAIPDAVVDIQAPLGSNITTSSTFDESRTDMINQLATDGGLDVYQDPAGLWVIRLEPLLTPRSPQWTYRSGTVGNIMTAARTRPFDRMYNTVVVRPIDDTQTWTQQTVSISDPNHPRHPDKIGVVPFFHSSPTLATAAEALNAANTILQRVLGTTETLATSVLGNPAQETGDTVTVAHPATDTDPGFGDSHIVDGFNLKLDSGDMDMATRSSALADVEES